MQRRMFLKGTSIIAFLLVEGRCWRVCAQGVPAFKEDAEVELGGWPRDRYNGPGGGLYTGPGGGLYNGPGGGAYDGPGGGLYAGPGGGLYGGPRWGPL
jgi:hypothetical protein